MDLEVNVGVLLNGQVIQPVENGRVLVDVRVPAQRTQRTVAVPITLCLVHPSPFLRSAELSFLLRA
jgi:hypothetical protein